MDDRSFIITKSVSFVNEGIYHYIQPQILISDIAINTTTESRIQIIYSC